MSDYVRCAARDLKLGNRVKLPQLQRECVLRESAYQHAKEPSWVVLESDRGRIVLPGATDVDAQLHRDSELHAWLRVTRPQGMWADLGAGNGLAGDACARVLREVGSTWERFAIDPRPGRRVLRGDARSVNARDGAFGWSLLNFVLHHIPEGGQERAVREAARVSREYLVVQEDVPDGTPEVERLLSKHAPLEQFRAIEDWTTLLEQVGEVVLVAQHVGRRWDVGEHHVPRVLFVVKLGDV